MSSKSDPTQAVGNPVRTPTATIGASERGSNLNLVSGRRYHTDSGSNNGNYDRSDEARKLSITVPARWTTTANNNERGVAVIRWREGDEQYGHDSSRTEKCSVWDNRALGTGSSAAATMGKNIRSRKVSDKERPKRQMTWNVESSGHRDRYRWRWEGRGTLFVCPFESFADTGRGMRTGWGNWSEYDDDLLRSLSLFLQIRSALRRTTSTSTL